MNAKERFYSGLAKETIGKITSNTDNWTSFLRTMSRNYEFTYPEQVMIYAQRPNATFCKPYEDWNAENYRRYVKRGSTGIALFVMNRDKPYLRYVFDVADTGVRRSSPELKPWEVTPENRSYVMEAMERTFGVAADGVLEAQLEDIASALAAEYWDDYKKQFLDIVANSFLEEYDELNIEVAFKNAVANSVSYTMYCRFVESPDNYFEHEDFQKVFDFNTRQTVNALGTAVNAISTRMFQEIEKAIGEHEQIKATERSTDYERDDLQTGRRLSDSEPSVGERGRETSGQVRQDASSIFGTEQSDAPERHDSDGEPVPAPVGDRGNSESQSGVSDGAVPEGQPRTGQGNAADGVGAAHEQPESTGGGSRDDGAYQQLSLNLFLSENEQISFIDRAESFTPSAFSFAQEEIDHFLLLGSNTDEARKVVALEYMKQKPLEEIVQTLKQVYHGGYGLKEDSGNICAWYAEDGIHLAKGSSAIDSPRAQIVSWETVAERIGELLENGRFATNVELVEASGYERQKLAESLWHLYHDLSEEARSSNYLAILHQEPFRGFPDETADLAEKLDDPRFHATLVQQYSEFRKTLAENPDLLRFHYHKLNLIQKQLYELNMPLREYQTDMMQMPLVRQFITDDEVNADLTRGSGFSGGKARIYNYWQENHSAKEKMDFLKHEYGTGGHSHACSGATHSGQDHDAKGVAYTKSGCDKLQMSWAQVVQRIDGLIRKGRYLSPEEEAERQAIEEAKTDPLEDVYDRFAVIDTEDGEYAIWDNQTDDYYVDPEGVTEYFTDEWLANDYLEEVRQSVAAMESVQPEAPVAEPAEVVEASASEEPKWNYQVGDTVYLDDTAFRVEQITDREVQLRDPTLAYPIFRAENRENFERMLSQDERNHAVRVDAQTEEKPVTEEFLGEAEPRDYTPEYQLLDRLRMDCEYFLGAGQHSEKHLWAGNRHAQIAKMRELYEMIPDKPEWLTPEMINSYEERMAPRYLVAAYHHFENGFDDKLDYYTLEEAEKAAQGYVDGTMEDDGFKYDGAAVYDQQEHKCIRIYGDYPDEKAHAQVRASAEPEQQEPEHFIDHFYVAEDIQKRGALDIKEYSSFDDALRAYYVLPDTQRKALGAMNTRDLPGSLDFVQCVAGKDTIIQDYAKMDGWQNAEVMNIIAQLEQSITTREIPPVPAVNFHITDDNIGEGGPKQKFARNIAAIETLFKLESENRNATSEEQEILSNYVGWGGLADAFDPDKGNWAQEYQTLKNLLSEDEYAAARASTLNAHYTSPTVIRSIYDAVGQMGFETGNILEPAMGVGNFFGMLPPEMQSSRLYGVELDSITGRIAQKLYPNAEIKVAGFETTERRDFYDLAVGNVPFGNYKVSDKPYDKLGFSIHNYFFAKALDQVRPGGVVAFVTSRYTMDSKNSDARRYMAQRAELLGAIRLPNDAFKKNAGTEVVSDILFLQKRDHPIDIVPEWVNLDRTEEGHTMNSYFVAHPEMVLGDTVEESTAYGMDITVRPIEGMELSELLKEAVSHIQGTYQAVELPEADKGKEIETIPATPDVKNFSYTVVDAEAKKRKLQVEYEQESGTFIPPSAKTVNDLLDEYMSIYGVNTWAMSTYESRKSLIANYIRPLIGDMKLEDVTPRIMDKYYRDLLSVKAVSSKYVKARTEYLTPHTVREVHKTLRNAFNQAVKWELMTRNPVEHATLPKEEHKTRDIWTAEVLQKALEACDDDILRLAINLAFSCSLRMGELLGLTWDCIDISPTSIELGQASIFVEKELQRVNREAMADLDGKDIMFKFPPTFASTHTALVLKTPKTKTSVRKVFLPKTVAEMLVQRKADIEELKDLFGDEFVDFNLVFCSSNGKPIEGQVINRAFNKLIEEKGLPKVVFHSLRHSSITYKLKLNGGDMKSVQGDSGHAQVKMVADVYSHIIDDDRRLNAERMEAAFYSGRQATPEPVQPAATESSADDKELLLKLLQNPEMAALLKSLAKTL